MKKKLLHLAMALGLSLCALQGSAQVAAPIMPASTTFTGTFSAPVSDATSGASKFCTTDGSTPQVAISPLYTGAFSFTGTTTLKCIAATSTTVSNDDQITTVGGSSIPRWQVTDTLANDGPGGNGIPQSTTQTFGVASPSKDGSSMLLSQKSSASTAYTNVLWPFLAAPCDSCTTFVSDFWVYPTGTTGVVALEFDTFNFNHTALTNEMFGHQFCYTSCGGIPGWNTWNQAPGGTHGWQGTGLNTPFTNSAWNHVIFVDYIVPGDTGCSGGYPHLHFYSITQNGTKTVWNQTFCAGSLNSTWSGHFGHQYQIDIDPTNTTVSMYIDESNVTAYSPGSAITTAIYTYASTPTAAAPTALPTSTTTYFATTSVTLASTTPSPTISYCIGSGCTPSITYSSPISVGTSEEICANTAASGYTTSATVCFNYTISIPAPTGSGNLDIGQVKPSERLGPGSLFQMTTKGAFSTIGTCNSTNEGATASVSDSATTTYAATITGSGSNHVHAYCNGTNWIVD